jgi:hypothetical protein
MKAQVVLDKDVQRILETMQRTIPASRLCAVAKGVGDIAPLLWSHHGEDEIEALRLVAEPFTTSCETRSDAILSAPDREHVGDDSVAAVCAP